MTKKDQEIRKLTIALAGNPNSGKTTIFNNLTGSRQRVGNWAGVTVEKKYGIAKYAGYEITVVDLPGTYSLTAYSIEEIISRDFIVNERPDVVVDILDAASLERNLYLATQCIELGVKMVFALNMVDTAEKHGMTIDENKLALLTGVPTVRTLGSKNQGTEKLLNEIIRVVEDKDPLSRHVHIPYGEEVEEEVKKLQSDIREKTDWQKRLSTRWLSVKLLEGDQNISGKVAEAPGGREILDLAQTSRNHLENIYETDIENILTDQRYGYIHGLCMEVVRRTAVGQVTLSEKIDKVLTHRLLGIPIFFGLMWIVYQLTFKLGDVPLGWIESTLEWLTIMLQDNMPAGLVRDLLINGVIGGVGGVILFIPHIMILFLCTSFLDDTGYMARAAFLMDRIMHLLGLHGKSFIALLMGIGCNVPAIMATRTLESKRDRILTILINPYISCSARLPIYILMTGAFFSHNAGNIIFSIYLLGIVLAILSGRLFKWLFFRGEAAPFVLELPPYRLPTFKSILIHMWEKGSVFIKKIWRIVFIGSVLIWYLGAFPRNIRYARQYEKEIESVKLHYQKILAVNKSENQKKQLEQERDQRIMQLSYQKEGERQAKSFLGRMGHVIEPLVRPLGFDWRNGVALVSGFVAKEIVVSVHGVLFQVGKDLDEGNQGLLEALRHSHMTPLIAYVFMVFSLLYTPCLAAVGAIKKETGSWKWTLFSVTYSLALAWIVAFAVYQAGKFLGLG